MADISITNPTIMNSETADVTKLTANDGDLLAGLTDGTKDIRVNSIYFDQSGTSDTGWYRISDTNTGFKIGGTKYIDINASGGVTGNVLIGTNANTADFSVAKLVSSYSNTGLTSAIYGGIVGEAAADGNGSGYGVQGYGITYGGNGGGGSYFNSGVNDATDSASSVACLVNSYRPHTGGDNIGLSARAENASSSGQNLGVDIVRGSLRINNRAADAAQTADADSIMLNGIDLSAGNTALSLRTEGGGCYSSGTATNQGTVAINVDGTWRYFMISNSAAT